MLLCTLKKTLESTQKYTKVHKKYAILKIAKEPEQELNLFRFLYWKKKASSVEISMVGAFLFPFLEEEWGLEGRILMLCLIRAGP